MVEALAERFHEPGVAAIALMGSHVRGDADRYSDIDLLRLLQDGARVARQPGSYLLQDRLVTVSDLTPHDVDEIFERPELATLWIAGLRSGRALIDRENAFQQLQERAHCFQWDSTMQARADRYASEQMAGWAEEVHKALGGLARQDIGRLLNARFGLNWGMTHVVRVQRGILLGSDNAIYEQINQAMGVDSEWVRLRQSAFGITPQADSLSAPAPSLEQQILAGLQLYVRTAEMLADSLQEQHRSLVLHTVQQVEELLQRYRQKD